MNNSELKFRSHHVERIAAKNENNQSATVMQNISNVGNETDLLVVHLMMTSLIISELAINDRVPPTLGIIAMDLAKGEYLSLIPRRSIFISDLLLMLRPIRHYTFNRSCALIIAP